MGTYRVYNENYSGFDTEDLSSIDFVEVDNAEKHNSLHDAIVCKMIHEKVRNNG